MPDSSEEGDIRGKIFESIGDDLAGEEGFQKLIDWLDKHFAQDKDIVMIDRIKQFMKFVRKPGMTITEFLAGFDTAYDTAIKKGLEKLPQPYLMFMIIENAGLSEQEIKFILSDVDKSKKDTLYDQTRNSMKKYLIGLNGEDGEELGLKLKTDNSVMYMNNRGRNLRPQAGSWKPNVPQYVPSNPIRHAQQRPNFGGGSSFARGFRPRVHVPVPRNPYKEGKQMLCDICGAFTHLQSKCPHNPNNKTYVTDNWEEAHEIIDEVEDYQYPDTLNENCGEELNYLTGHAQNIANAMGASQEQKQFYAVLDTLTVMEVLSSVAQPIQKFSLMDEIGVTVLDTGCIKTVSGQLWFDAFVDSLSQNTRKMISAQPSNNVFKFGGGTRLKSMGLFSVPCSLAGKNIILTIDVVKQSDLPCLLSKESMKNAQVNIDVATDSIKIFGRHMKLDTNNSGHYTLQLRDLVGNINSTDEEYKVLWQAVDGKDSKEDFIRLKKMHEGLGHPGRQKFEEMLRATGNYNKCIGVLLNKLYENCLTCIKFKKSIPRPHVSPPIGTDFNKTIVVDLKIWPKKNKIILYIIDAYSRFTMAIVVPNKQADSIVEPIMDRWILNLFGPPEQILFDNGKEFSNIKMREMCEKFNIKMLTTGAYSPFQNGLCEKNHHTVDLMVEKILDSSPKMDFRQALSAAVFAKNTLLNVSGYSPMQITFGKQPNIPGAAHSNLPPANEEVVNSVPIFDRLKAIFEARKAFTQIENSARLKKALKVKPQRLELYNHGDRVFYKFGTDGQWHGPGTVIGTDNKVIFIRHGGNVISTSQTRLMRANMEDHRELLQKELSKPELKDKESLPSEDKLGDLEDDDSDIDQEDIGENSLIEVRDQELCNQETSQDIPEMPIEEQDHHIDVESDSI